MSLDANNAVPLYKQLKIALKNDILNEVYTNDSRIPSQSELEKMFNVSRITVRYALQELVDEGLLIRMRGKGTFVKHTKVRGDMRSIRGFTNSINSSGQNPKCIIHSKQLMPATDKIASFLQISTGDQVFELKRTISSDNMPVAYEHVYYPNDAYPGLIERIKNDMSTYDVLKNVYGTHMTKAYKEFNVDIADLKFSQLLGCRLGAPLFYIRKIVYDQHGKPVNFSKFWILADCVTYVLDPDQSFDVQDNQMRCRED